MKKTFLIIFLIFSGYLFAQEEHKRDSLYKLLETKKADTTVIDIYNQLCWPIYSFSNIDSAIKYGEKAIALSTKIKDEKRLSVAYRRLGIAYINSAQSEKAENCEKKSYELAKKIGFKRGMASALNNLGVIHLNISDYRKAIEYNIESQKIQEEIKDSINLFQAYYNTAILFKNINDFKSAKIYYTKALAIAGIQKKNSQFGFATSGIGSLFKHEHQYDSALVYYTKAGDLFAAQNNQQGLIENYINMGGLYAEWNQTENNNNMRKSLGYYLKAKTLCHEYNNPQTEANIFGNIAFIYQQLAKPDSIIYYGKTAVELSQKIGDFSEVAFSSRILSEAYLTKGKPAEALRYLKMHLSAKDSAFNMEKQREITQKQMRFEFDKKTLADSLQFIEQQKNTLHRVELADEKLKREKFFRYALIGGIILVIGFLAFLINRFNVIKKKNSIIELQNQKVTQQKNIIEQKNKEVTDSINYAKRIQQAVLTGEDVWTKISKEYFILFKPKDIVSGDFFWAHTTPNGRCIWALADCTGHGVPGGFMSMLGNSFLNEIVVENRIYSPAEILNRLRDKIIHALEQKGVGEQKDGMDIALCLWNKVDNTLEFAGANNSAWLVRGKQLAEIKPDKMPIGLYAGEQKKFTAKKVELQKGDIIYLSSDGYPDQFGGAKGKKFKYKQLQEQLMALSAEPMNKQKQLLEEAFYQWKGELEQVDDVCLIGMKI